MVAKIYAKNIPSPSSDTFHSIINIFIATACITMQNKYIYLISFCCSFIYSSPLIGYHLLIPHQHTSSHLHPSQPMYTRFLNIRIIVKTLNKGLSIEIALHQVLEQNHSFTYSIIFHPYRNKDILCDLNCILWCLLMG